MSDEFRLDIVQGDERTCVVLVGEVDLAARGALDEALTDVCSTPSAPVDIDLSQVSFIDSTGVAALVAAQRISEAHDGSLRLVGPQPQVRRLLELTGVDTFIEISPD